MHPATSISSWGLKDRYALDISNGEGHHGMLCMVLVEMFGQIMLWHKTWATRPPHPSKHWGWFTNIAALFVENYSEGWTGDWMFFELRKRGLKMLQKSILMPSSGQQLYCRLETLGLQQKQVDNFWRWVDSDEFINDSMSILNGETEGSVQFPERSRKLWDQLFEK